MITNLRQQGDVIGPQLTLQSALGHREVAHRLAQTAPTSFQQRTVSAYAELAQLIGWLCFNMGDYHSAQHYYEDARSAAHDAQNVELVTFVLCSMSHLATWQGKPRVGLDHTAAAAAWATQTNSSLAQAYASDVAARAYAADNKPVEFQVALDREYTALTAQRSDEPTASWWYVCNESCYWGTAGEGALNLRNRMPR
ncbi:MAG: hypothetical protein ACRDTX_01920 [Pseudonocardiaceae bacterium]